MTKEAKIIKHSFILGLLLIFSLTIQAQNTSNIKNTYKLKKVVIDAGHGGKDSGCNGIHTKEKDVALGVSLRLGALITKYFPETEVIYTRKKDVFIPLHERAEIANKHKADLFISIHCNAVAKKSSREMAIGTETYVMGLHKATENLAVVKRENEVITMEADYKENYDGFDPNSPESHIMSSLFQGAFLEQSISFASKIEDEFALAENRTSRGVKQAGFVVLRATTMPSVLIETGFLTNSKEEKFLTSKVGQQKTANAIYRAFKAYKTEVEGRKAVPMNIQMADVAAPAKTSKPKAAPKAKPIAKKTVTKPKKIIPQPAAPKARSVSLKTTAPKKTEVTQPAIKKEPTMTKIASYEKVAPQKSADFVEKSPEVMVNNSGLLFKIQLASASTSIPNDHPLKIKVPSLEENKVGTGYKYTVGAFKSYEECLVFISKWKAKGFKDAFIVAFNNGKKMNLSDARKIGSKY